MQVAKLIEELQKIDPEEDIFMLDGEYGPTEIYQVAQEMHYAITQSGKQLPRMVWVIQ
jgi:hypothetical protein